MTDEEREAMTASDVQDMAGLSYRQLNDWEAKGAVDREEGRGAKWRRFEPRQVFALMVCAELRKRFGASVEQVGFVYRFMLQDGANHLKAAAELMAMLGVGVWLLTDFEETFIMDSELEFFDLWQLEFFGGEKEAGYVLLKLNPLVNKILAAKTKPVHLETHGLGYDIMRQSREQYSMRSPEEFAVIQLIRKGEFDRVELILKDGTIRTIKTTKNHEKTTSITDLLRRGDFQKVTITKQGGKVVEIKQEETTKVDE